MARITQEGLEACLAFGTAALAVAEVAEMAGDGLTDRTTLGAVRRTRRRALPAPDPLRPRLGPCGAFRVSERPGAGGTDDGCSSEEQGPDQFVSGWMSISPRWISGYAGGTSLRRPPA